MVKANHALSNSALIFCKTGLMWVVKRAISLFNSICSNVARQVALCFLFFPYLKRRFRGFRHPHILTGSLFFFPRNGGTLVEPEAMQGRF